MRGQIFQRQNHLAQRETERVCRVSFLPLSLFQSLSPFALSLSLSLCYLVTLSSSHSLSQSVRLSVGWREREREREAGGKK